MRPLAEQRERNLAPRKTVRVMPSPFTAKVVGVSFVDAYPDNLWALDRAAIEAQRDGEPLVAVLVREPDNPVDPLAVAVHVPALGDEWGKVGHLTRPVANRLAEELDDGIEWSAEVVEVKIHPDRLNQPGIEIRCTRVHREGQQ